MIVLISSGGEEIYKQFVLRVLCYPTGHILADIPYSRGRVAEQFKQSTDPLISDEEGAVIVLVDYEETGDTNNPLQPVFLPLRTVKIINPRRVAGKLLLDARLGDYCYYDEDVQKGYSNQAQQIPPSRMWSAVIAGTDQSPHAMPKDQTRQIDPKDHSTWVSAGNFVLSVPAKALDFKVNGDATTVRSEREDWKLVVDMITRRTQFEEKLFYQIWALQRPALDKSNYGFLYRLRNKFNSEDKKIGITTMGGRSVYQLTAGDSAELGLHFYHGRKKQKADQRLLEITTEDAYLASLGMREMEVYSGQTSGKIEQLQLIAKQQLSQQFTRITICEKQVPGASSAIQPALASTELYLHIRPRRWHIALILIMFFAGTFLNAVPDQTRGKWVWKIIGSVLMTLAFWIGFSKLPSGK